MYHGELLIRIIVAVSTLAGTHSVVTGPVKNSCQRVLGQIRWNQFRVERIRIGRRLTERPIRNVPYCASAHYHVPRRRAHATHPRPHLVCAINHHTLSRQFFDDWRIQLTSLIIKLEIKRRLIVNNDVEDVRPLQCLIGPDRDRQAQCGNEEECEFFHG